jgi:hypothetical protein
VWLKGGWIHPLTPYPQVEISTLPLTSPSPPILDAGFVSVQIMLRELVGRVGARRNHPYSDHIGDAIWVSFAW